MFLTLVIIGFCGVGYGCFVIGGRWKVMNLADELRANGKVVAQWGDSTFVVITGSVEDHEAI